jgi:hypothetical protein
MKAKIKLPYVNQQWHLKGRVIILFPGNPQVVCYFRKNNNGEDKSWWATYNTVNFVKGRPHIDFEKDIVHAGFRSCMKYLADNSKRLNF